MTSAKTGHFVQKAWGWFSSREDIRNGLEKHCAHEPHEHDPMEGNITSSTAIYPRALCETFATILDVSQVSIAVSLSKER